MLTKPDKIERGEEHRWLKYIQGEAEPLTHGWFCVKLRSPEDLRNKITWSEARIQEDAFFRQEPWSSLEHLRHHLSTANLTVKLSEILSELIAQRFVISAHFVVVLPIDRYGDTFQTSATARRD